jgi:hypothetical protein
MSAPTLLRAWQKLETTPAAESVSVPSRSNNTNCGRESEAVLVTPTIVPD